jgi:hypothetical protein
VVIGSLGWMSLTGRVIQVEAIYMATPDFPWTSFLIKLGLVSAAIYYYGVILLVALVLFLLLMWMVSKVPFLSTLTTQVLGFMLTRRLMGPVANVPVRDIRVRDSSGIEHLVRIKGQLTSGAVAVGDDVTVEGWNRGGMLLFRRGYNQRVRTAIKVKVR